MMVIALIFFIVHLLFDSFVAVCLMFDCLFIPQCLFSSWLALCCYLFLFLCRCCYLQHFSIQESGPSCHLSSSVYIPLHLLSIHMLTVHLLYFHNIVFSHLHLLFKKNLVIFMRRTTHKKTLWLTKLINARYISDRYIALLHCSPLYTVGTLKLLLYSFIQSVFLISWWQ